MTTIESELQKAIDEAETAFLRLYALMTLQSTLVIIFAVSLFLQQTGEGV